MEEPRIVVTTEELAKNIRIWLSVLSQRRPSLLHDLWARRGERPDTQKQDHARYELARYIAEKLAMAKHQVTRPELAQDRIWREVQEEQTGD